MIKFSRALSERIVREMYAEFQFQKFDLMATQVRNREGDEKELQSRSNCFHQALSGVGKRQTLKIMKGMEVHGNLLKVDQIRAKKLQMQ